MKNTTKAHKQALEKVIMIGKEKGYLTYSELNDLLPKDLLTQDQIEPIKTILEELDIVVSCQCSNCCFCRS
jgi:RNA polymerase primary sigma factor